jgi:hypothetical protein
MSELHNTEKLHVSGLVTFSFDVASLPICSVYNACDLLSDPRL